MKFSRRGLVGMLMGVFGAGVAEKANATLTSVVEEKEMVQPITTESLLRLRDRVPECLRCGTVVWTLSNRAYHQLAHLKDEDGSSIYADHRLFGGDIVVWITDRLSEANLPDVLIGVTDKVQVKYDGLSMKEHWEAWERRGMGT